MVGHRPEVFFQGLELSAVRPAIGISNGRIFRYEGGVLPIHVISHSPQETRATAAALAPTLRAGSVLALHGDLGAGKTCFIQGLAEALGVTDAVSSPTYTLISEYRGRLPFYHADLYRLDDPAEALRTGLDEYLHGNGVTAVEWAERAGSLMPTHTIHVRLRAGEQPGDRVIEITEGGKTS